MIRAALLFALSACSVGMGSAYVGQWRPHAQIDFDACRVDAAGQCVDQKQIVSQSPPRKFSGVNVTFPSLGIARVDHGDLSATRVRLAPSFEILEGAGRAAIGLRSGAIIDARTRGDGTSSTAGVIVPLDVLGHWSLTDRIGIYGGVGYVPYAEVDTGVSHVGARGIGGVQVGLRRDLEERYMVLTFEADTTYVDLARSYRTSGLTANLGVFF